MERLIDFGKLYFTNKPNRNLNGQSQCYRCKAMGKFNVGWSCMMTTFKQNGHHYCDECKKFVQNRISLLKKKYINLDFVNKVLIHGIFYEEYGEKELKHTCNLSYTKSGNYYVFKNKSHTFYLDEYMRNWWARKDKSE